MSCFLEALFTTGCAFPLDTIRSERERELTDLLQLMAHRNPSIDGAGADGSAQGRSRFFYRVFLYEHGSLIALADY